MHMRGNFYSDFGGGMGRRTGTKTLTPYHYDDSLEDPWRTKLLLRAWALNRTRERGWCRAREGREREARQQSESICLELRRGHLGTPRKPLLDSAAAHLLFVKWIPEEVASLVAAG